MTNAVAERWIARLAERREKIPTDKIVPPVEGRITRMVGLTLEAVGCQAAVGDRCRVQTPGRPPIEAEVVGFDGEKLFLMPSSNVHGIMPNARVIPLDDVEMVSVGDGLLGRVIDGQGRPLDGLEQYKSSNTVTMNGHPINPMSRAPIDSTIDVGVRAINSLFTVGRGQRMGLFAGPGVGKSTLLGMMARYTAADVVVVGLIGERGREVKEFIEHILGEQGRSRSVVVAAPADAPPLMRLHGAQLANSIAEYYRDQGKDVLLLMDSLTRYAQAQREIALSTGELPATRGYPPSVFAKLPALVERAGNGPENGGSITAFYTVLTEGEDTSDPVAEAARAILDGHLVLSRELAEAGHFPAIDPEASISRVMTQITTPEHRRSASIFRKFYSRYQQSRDLIAVGAYQQGRDPELDQAIALQPRLAEFLQQQEHSPVTLEQAVTALDGVLGIQNSASAA